MQAMKKLCQLLVVGFCLASLPSVRAEKIFGLEEDGTLFTFDSASPGITRTVGTLFGAEPGQIIIGMDFRPATRELIAISYEPRSLLGSLYKVNTSTATLTPIGSGFLLPLGTAGNCGFDIDPVTDTARAVFAAGGKNLRISLKSGRLITEDASILTGSGISALAYANNTIGATWTTLYAYDFNRDELVTIGGLRGSPKPSKGQVFRISRPGVQAALSRRVSLDISGKTGVGYAIVASAINPSGFYTFSSRPNSGGEFIFMGNLFGRDPVDISVQPSFFYRVTVKAAPLGFGEAKSLAENKGRKFILKAKPSFGRTFSGWYEGEELVSKKPKLIISSLNSHRTITAKFE